MRARGAIAAGLLLLAVLALVVVAPLSASGTAPAGPPPGGSYGSWGHPTVGPAISAGKDPLTGRGCKRVHLQYAPSGNASHQARTGKDPLFRRILIPGLTDNDNGGIHGALVGLADLNHDGRTDVLLMQTNKLELFLNQGCWRFVRHPLHITGPGWSAGASSPPENEGIAFADFNGDGNLDIVITRSTLPNSLLMSQGRFDTFRDVAAKEGITNSGAYSRGISIGDVNGDGHLDIAIGADQIGTTAFGKPYQRLYIYDPATHSFNDAGGTSAVPGFGGAPNCNPAHDRNSPGILLRDLAGQGRLDLVQGYHDDMNRTKWSAPCNTGERKFGIYSWRNTSQGGRTSYQRIKPGSNGLGGVGQMRYDPSLEDYVTVSHGLGLPYISAFDAFNTGRLDLMAIGPTDYTFHVNSDQIAGKFFVNRGGMRFRDDTRGAGLGALNWTYKRSSRFYHSKIHPDPLLNDYCQAYSNRKRECLKAGVEGLQQYASSITWGDYNNDGCPDFVESDRHESAYDYGTLRNTLFMNNCHGRFHPVTTYASGLDTNTETMEAADLTGNGLLDLVAGVQPSNTFPIARQLLPADRSYTKAYMNSGAFGGKTNHWLEVRLSGAPQRKLVGSELYLYGSSDHKLLGRRDLFTTDAYKTAHDLIAHWGLAHRDGVYLRARLPINRWRRFHIPCIDHRITLNVHTGRVSGCGRLRISASARAIHARTRVTVTVEQPADPSIAGGQKPIPTAGARVSIAGHRAHTDARGRATPNLTLRRGQRGRVKVAVPGLAPRSVPVRAR